MAMYGVTQGLLDCGHAVRVLSLSSDKHPVAADMEDTVFARQTQFQSVSIDLTINPVDATIALLCGESYNVKRFYSKDFDRLLTVILQSETFDIVHVESIFMAPYLDTIRRFSKAPVVLRAHNVEHRIWQQIAKGERRYLRRWYLKHLALSLRQYELEKVNIFDGIVCITEADADMFRQLGCRKRMVSIPFGVDLKPLTPTDPEPNSLFHIGSMDWMPNQASITWFLDKVWPLLHREMPQLHLYLAGRRMPTQLLQSRLEGVTVVGEVEDSGKFIASKQINIVPLLSGSGIRIKIIEAMSLGKAIVTTSVGAAGIDYTDGHNLLIADTAEGFVNQVRRLIDNPELSVALGQNARKLVETHYCRKALAERLSSFYETLLQ